MIGLYILIGLQALDIATTLVALRNPALAEANPFLRKLFDRFGPAPVLLVTKGVFVALMWFLHPHVPQPALWALVAFYVWVVQNNVKLIWKV